MTDRLTAAQYMDSVKGRATAKPKRSKYRNKRVTTEDGDFDSQSEARRWADLKNLERAGLIRDLKRQVAIPLFGRDGPLRGENGRARVYVADFTYFEHALGADVVEDRKGFKTADYLLKKSILRAQGVDIRETRE